MTNPHAGADALPVRPGAHITKKGASFVLRCRRARTVEVMLFRHPEAEEPASIHALDRLPETDFWRLELPGVKAGGLYGYRITGDDPDLRNKAWVLDPSARAVTFSGRRWGERAKGPTGKTPRRGARFPKAVLIDDAAFDWGEDTPPRTPWNETFVYELHVRGFTRGRGAGVRHPGTYEGLVERIPYLRDLGVTAVELLPVHEFDELEFHLAGGPRAALLNYWGYNPIAFSAPMSRYAADPMSAVNAFKGLVKALHDARIEVILDVVYNHTGEGDARGPAYHFKHLDPGAYYLTKADGQAFRDFTGCGNTFNANSPEGIEAIVDSLCVWVEAMHVDGFRFDLATALTRGEDGEVLDAPPLLERIAAEPRLRGVKCIAEPWDAVGHHHGGRFPAPEWAEWNDRFRDDVRRFWSGERGLLGAFATRLAGSSDLFQPAGRRPTQGINFIACHDGFPLGDLVRYKHKHNRANGEENRDGANVNFSVNYGVEGDSEDPGIAARREPHMKNLVATLFMAQGVPMLSAGDEIARTQGGNNNAYAQDNEISWIDWTFISRYRDLHAFTRRLIAFRNRHRALRRDRFFEGIREGANSPDIEWFGPEDQPPDWAQGLALACRIDGAARHTGADRDEPSLFLAFNAGLEPARFVLPAAPDGWRLAWATQTPEPELPEPGGLLELSPASAAAIEGAHEPSHTTAAVSIREPLGEGASSSHVPIHTL